MFWRRVAKIHLGCPGLGLAYLRELLFEFIHAIT
jgi:hypothetical protein